MLKVGKFPVYTGSSLDARDAGPLDVCRVRYIIDVAAEIAPNTPHAGREGHPDVVWFPMEDPDGPSSTNRIWAPVAAHALDQAVRACSALGGSVLVHCAGGLHRSRFVVILWLVGYMGHPVHSAAELLRIDPPRRWMVEMGYNWQVTWKEEK